MADAGVAPAAVDDIATTCDRIFIAVYSAEQARSALASIGRGSAGPLRVYCATTVQPADAVDLVVRAEALAIELIEFPISGSSAEVLAGEAFGLVGPSAARAPGPCADSDDLLLAAVTPAFTRFPEVGDASKAKLAINLVLELNRTALAEGLVFAEALGLDGELLAPALLRSAAESRVMHRKLPKMLDGEFSAEGRLEQSLKDVHSMLECARRGGVRLPLLEAQANLLASGVAAGEGHRDNSVVIEELRRRVE
ncbi:MAG: hypothetical protein QOJ66_3325, partial [Ilumatobacteraceae bacterium]